MISKKQILAVIENYPEIFMYELFDKNTLIKLESHYNLLKAVAESGVKIDMFKDNK